MSWHNALHLAATSMAPFIFGFALGGYVFDTAPYGAGLTNPLQEPPQGRSTPLPP